MGGTDIVALVLLAKEGATRRDLKLSLDRLAKRMGVSRQTAARRLAEFEGQDLIKRTVEPRGQRVWITPAGMAVLRAFHRELGSILESMPRPIVLSGRVVTGIGEGGYYMSQTHYIRQFEREAGFTPYPGTLDIKLERDSLELKEMLARLPSREIPGFETRERTFGPVKFFPAKFKKSKVAIVIPLRSHHTDIVEIVAPQNLRKALGLMDGNLVHVEVTV